MKQIAAFLMLLFALSCKKDAGIIKFKTGHTTDIVIPANSAINLPITINGPEKQTNIIQELENNDSRIDRVKSIHLQKLSLTIKNPPDKTFSFLKSLKLFIKAEGLEETEVAYLDDIPANVGGYLELTIHYKDLAPYVKKDKY